MTDSVPATGADPDRRAMRNVVVLAFANAVLGSQLAMNAVVAGYAGERLAPDPAFATLPLSILVLGSLFSTPVVSLFMGRYGRRAGFLVGALAGGSGSAVSAYALFSDSFELFLLGAVLLGIYQATQGFLRFAAADTGTESFKPKAISWVFAGGLLSALIGPEIPDLTSAWFPEAPYAGAYLAAIGLNVVGALGLVWLDIPQPKRAAGAVASGRPLAVIVRQPAFIVAALAGMVGFASMSLVMTSTPLAMEDHGFMTHHAADVVRWHILAMFAPSFFTGSIIARFGRLPVIAVGLLILGACGAIAATGVELHHFYLALVALGLGWNFSFIGATALLSTTHTPAERAKVQGLNDFLVLGLVAVASFSSGALLDSFGWNAVQYAMAPALVAALLGLGWLRFASRAVRTG